MMVRILLIVAVLCLIANIALAEEFEKPDPRLDQKVTYQAKGELLYKVLEDLAEKTDVTMSCGVNLQDWQVRDRKITIFVKDMPLKDLQATIAEVMHFTWSQTEKDGVFSYRLYQTAKQKAEEQALRDKRKHVAAEKIAAKRASFLSDIDSLNSLTPDQIESLKHDSLYLYCLAKKGVGQALAAYLRADPKASAAIASGTSYRINLDEVPATVAQAARVLMDTYQQASNPSPSSVGSLFSVDDFGSPECGDESEVNFCPAEIQISADCNEDDDERPMYSLGDLRMYTEDDSSMSIPLCSRSDFMGMVLGVETLGLMENRTQEDIVSEIRPVLIKMLSSKTAESDGSELPDDDPDLGQPIKHELKELIGKDFSSVIERLVEKYDVQVVSDHFMSITRNFPGAEPKENLGGLLRFISNLYGKNATKSGKLVTFVDRDWFRKCTWEIPEALWDRWRKAVENDELQLQHLIEMAALTDDQLDHSLCEEEKLQPFAYEVDRNKDVLRFYSKLTHSQKRSLINPKGLNLGMVDPELLSKLDCISWCNDIFNDIDFLPDNTDIEPGVPAEYYSKLVMYLDQDAVHGRYKFCIVDLSIEPDSDTGEFYEMADWCILTKLSAIEEDRAEMERQISSYEEEDSQEVDE